MPTWVCQLQVVTTERPTLGASSDSKQHKSTTQRARDLGNLRCTGRTVHGGRADWREDNVDYPWDHGGPSKIATRTSSSALRKMDCPWWTRGLSASSRTIQHSSTSCTKNKPAKRIEQKTRKNMRRTRRTTGLLALRGPSALRPRTVARCANSDPSSTLWRSTPPSFCPISRIKRGIATKS
jgi:hypothetical protein